MSPLSRVLTVAFVASLTFAVWSCSDDSPGDGDDTPGGEDGGGDGGGTLSDGGPLADTCFGPAGAALENARLPSGYCAWTWAEGLSHPRGVVVASNGDVLVVEATAGRVTALFDADGDGVSGDGERAVLAQVSNGNGDTLNHGIALSATHLYASSTTRVYRWPYTAGTRASLGTPELVVRGMPAGGHGSRTVVLDAEGRLYVSVGSAGNVDPDSSRSRIRRFSVAQVAAGNVAFADGEVFADGLRNEVGLAFDAQGQLWGVENGRDQLVRGDLGGDIHNDNPGEELNLFAEPGRFYGYPYCWSEFLLTTGAGQGPGTQWADPTFLNDGTHTDAWCRDESNVVRPRWVLPAHVAPLDLTFYPGGSFPDSEGSVFVSLHGSWNRDEPQGYSVMRVRFENGAPVSADTLLEYDSTNDTGAGWPHRPVAVKVGPRGELYVSSDASSVILAVGHKP